MIPGHPVGAAGIPPTPDPAGVQVAWELVPIEDGFGRDEVTQLQVVERERGVVVRELADLGVRGGCREVAPPMLRAPGDGGAHRIGALRSVQCERPERAVFSLTRTPSLQWEVLRSGCARPSRACVQHGTDDEIVGRFALDGPLGARVAGALSIREQGPWLRASPGAPRDAVRVRWAWTNRVDDGTGANARNLALLIDGAVFRRVDFGAMTACRAVAAREGATSLACTTLDEGAATITTQRAGDVLQVRTSLGEAAAIVAVRVGLPRGITVHIEGSLAP
jgi:hypothetical protein